MASNLTQLDIIDAHMHLWDYDSGNYPWLLSKLPGSDKMIGNYDPIRKNYLVSDYQNESATNRIKKSIHIQVFGYPEDPVLETLWLQTQANQYGYPHGIVAFVDFNSDSVEKSLQRHCQASNLRGIRNVLSHHDKDPQLCMIEDKNIMKSSKWRDGFSLLATHGLNFDVQLYDHQLEDLAHLAQRFPNTKIIINHLAWPTDLSVKGFNNWKSRIDMIASQPNVYMKISGVGCVFKSKFKEKAPPYLIYCLEQFGADRCLFGSNFPVASLFMSYDELLSFYDQTFGFLDETAKRKIFSENTIQVYRL